MYKKECEVRKMKAFYAQDCFTFLTFCLENLTFIVFNVQMLKVLGGILDFCK